MAAVHRTPEHPPEAYYRANVLGALNVTRALKQARVDTSSISVYGPQETCVTERSPLTPISDYGRSKQMAEVISPPMGRAQPARKLVTVRPGVVFGPGERGNDTFLARALQRRISLYPGRRDAIKSGGYVGELLETFAFALSFPQAQITYNFAFPAPSTTEDIVRAFHTAAGLPRPRGTAALPLMLAAAGGFEALGGVRVEGADPPRPHPQLANSAAVAPQWLVENGYAFLRDLLSAPQAWRDETQGKFV